MTDIMVHRGPDDAGTYLRPGVALGMRRLSVVDPQGGTQPVCNEDGSVVAVFNGEIYNFRELRTKLRQRGHRLVSAGDTETLPHLYEEFGLEFVHHLRGMFAIALWDARLRRLVLVRDRMGVKPLYLAEDADGLAFASEIKCLLAGGLVAPASDPVGAGLFLAFGYVPGPGTLFAGIRKLDPASMLVWEDGTMRDQRRYWSPWDNPPSGVGMSWQEDQERLLQLVRKATHDRLVSDVPLGVMLSGGLDSSLITALAAEATPGPVRTFAVGFAEDEAANELADARLVARRLGTDHSELLTSAVDHPELLERALWHLEEPIADLSFVGFMLLSELAGRTVTVALSGQGADELLGGYRKHQIAAAADLVNRVPTAGRVAAALGSQFAPDSSMSRGMLAIGAQEPATRMLAMSRVLSARVTAELVHAELASAMTIRAAVERHGDDRNRSILARTMDMDTHLALVDSMLLYFDKMSMAHSLEVRVPFLDHDVVAFCYQLPDDRRVWRGRRKELLRRASRGLLDDAVLKKKKRGFFRSATGTWLGVNQQLVSSTLLDDRTRARGQLNVKAVERVLRTSRGHRADNQIFSLFMLELWQRLWVDDGGSARSRAARA